MYKWIIHDFPFIYIPKVLKEVLETEAFIAEIQ